MSSMSQILSTKESRKVENKPLNRYVDVVPCKFSIFNWFIPDNKADIFSDDKTRVKLERYNLNYINASHVCVPAANRKYILTQVRVFFKYQIGEIVLK